MTDKPANKHPSGLGDLIVRHLAKIVIGLGAVLAFVWQASRVAANLETRIDALEVTVIKVEKTHKTDTDRLSRKLERIRYNNRKEGAK